jgi:phenylacetate-CoA ligase
VVPDGEKGELVFTSLTKEAMPVIRYRTRDLTRLLPGTARSLRRMEKVTGRTDDMMIIRGVNVFPTQIEEKLLAIPALSMHYQIVLSREGRMDQMEIQVEARPDACAPDVRKAAVDRLERAVKETIGITARVNVVDPERIERSLGKARRIVDHRPKE